MPLIVKLWPVPIFIFRVLFFLSCISALWTLTWLSLSGLRTAGWEDAERIRSDSQLLVPSNVVVPLASDQVLTSSARTCDMIFSSFNSKLKESLLQNLLPAPSLEVLMSAGTLISGTMKVNKSELTGLTDFPTFPPEKHLCNWEFSVVTSSPELPAI